ncbi:hypothetical protein ACFW9N_41845 [Streptomyces sp. NPDC059496]|uniref:hypothetical protein n=1 Tax=Streptomyces sp. NPDC059496 TaxID=3346851 RepID=UPI00369FA5B5
MTSGCRWTTVCGDGQLVPVFKVEKPGSTPTAETQADMDPFVLGYEGPGSRAAGVGLKPDPNDMALCTSAEQTV